MTPMPAFSRRFMVAKYSVVRKLGAFHLIPSAMDRSTPRIALRMAWISALNGCCRLFMNASTASVVSAFRTVLSLDAMRSAYSAQGS